MVKGVSMDKKCPSGKVFNPHTRRCINPSGATAKKFGLGDFETKKVATKRSTKKVASKKSPAKVRKDIEDKECPEGKVLNTKTRRCINSSGATAKRLGIGDFKEGEKKTPAKKTSTKTSPQRSSTKTSPKKTAFRPGRKKSTLKELQPYSKAVTKSPPPGTRYADKDGCPGSNYFRDPITKKCINVEGKRAEKLQRDGYIKIDGWRVFYVNSKTKTPSVIKANRGSMEEYSASKKSVYGLMAERNPLTGRKMDIRGKIARGFFDQGIIFRDAKDGKIYINIDRLPADSHYLSQF